MVKKINPVSSSVFYNLKDNTKEIKSYTTDLLEMVRKEFYKKNLNRYDYEKFVNYLTCLKLQVDDMSTNLDKVIDNAKGSLLDIKI